MKSPKPGHWPASVAALLLVTGFLTACDALAPVEEITFENPIDPSGSEFVPPTTTITGGPSDGSTVTTNSATFDWTGNKSDTRFRYRMSGGEWAGTGWSPWGTQQSYTMDFLDELSYSFEVQAGYANDPGDPTEVDDTPESRDFTVNAVTGPALRLSPTRIHSPNNTTFDLQIIAEDVTDLTMSKITIRFNSGMLQYADSYSYGTFLTSNGGSVQYFDPVIDNVSGLLEFNFGIAGGSTAGVSGTGMILTISFRGTSTGTTDVTFGAANTLLRNDDNNPITITPSDLYGARVIIQ
ncbi:MAG: hypothetical protein KAT18_02065 [Candidatus Latescibacteria bacterium]|nr:hypothetical protein [Candidatus Latescibacterota bacterium]